MCIFVTLIYLNLTGNTSPNNAEKLFIAKFPSSTCMERWTNRSNSPGGRKFEFELHSCRRTSIQLYQIANSKSLLDRFSCKTIVEYNLQKTFLFLYRWFSHIGTNSSFWWYWNTSRCCQVHIVRIYQGFLFCFVWSYEQFLTADGLCTGSAITFGRVKTVKFLTLYAP